MLQNLVLSKICCIFATVLERKPKHETYFTLSPTNRNLVHFNREAKSNRFRVYESYRASYMAWSIISLCICRVYQSLVCYKGNILCAF